MAWLSGLLLATLFLPTALALAWLIEVVMGCIFLRKPFALPATYEWEIRKTILIPAHNESSNLLPTLHDAAAQLGPRDRILVVADNCTDDTAEVARCAGADVIVRTDATRRGKGYALEYGVSALKDAPPDVVVVMDADCRIGENAIAVLANSAMATGRAAQALYFMEAPIAAPTSLRVAEFAYRIRNWLRPLGMGALKLPCPLFGTGMAFPYDLISGRDLGQSRLAEDTALGLALARVRRAAIFYPQAVIYSQFPNAPEAAEAQRARWEKGNFVNALDLIPRAFASALAGRNWQLAVLAVDLAIPPLAFLGVLSFGAAVLGGLATLLGASSLYIAVPSTGIAVLLSGVMLSWLCVGRDLLTAQDFLQLPLYMVQKIRLYRAIASGRAASSWVKTKR